ncbi:MAG: DUF4214 domain-containing protein [Oscillospiraceae bacterium]|nr:DUF4214 domain-containing protein [Oscillospiraceae bacterium]
MKKRLLSLLLVLCMVIGMLPVNALAADNEEPVTVEETAQTLPPEAEELPTEEETQPETETPETAEELTAGVDEVLAEEPLLEDGEPEPEPEPAGQVKVIVENTTYMAGPWKGTLVNAWVDINTKSTMMSAVVDALTANGYSQTGAESGYISAINGLAAFDGGNDSGWMGTLNDWFTNEGFSAYTVKSGKLQSGDEIRLMYTTALGEDLGGSWTNADKTLKALGVSAGTLAPAFDKATHEYTLNLTDETAVIVTPTAANKNYQVHTYVGAVEYKRTAAIPVEDGTVITVKSGDPAWPTMNDNSAPAEVYTITVAKVEPHTPITAYVNISKDGALLKDKSGEPTARMKVELDTKTAYTIDDILRAAHAQYAPGGEAAYGSENGAYGLNLTRLWGVENGGSYGYQINAATREVMGLTDAVADGDTVDACIYENTYPNTEDYTAFTAYTAETETGKALELTLNYYPYDPVTYAMVKTPLSGAVITVDGEATSYTTDADGKVTLTLTEEGEHVISAAKTKTILVGEEPNQTEKTVTAITAPVCVVTAEAPVFDPAKLMYSDFRLYASEAAYEADPDSYFPLTPAYDPNREDQLHYTATVPDYLTNFFGYRTIEGVEGKNGYLWNNFDYNGYTFSIFSSGKWSSWQGGSSGVTGNQFMQKTNTFEDAGMYLDDYLRTTVDGKTIKVANVRVAAIRTASLKSLAIDGVWVDEFAKENANCSIFVDQDSNGIDITATGYQSGYTVTIGETTEKSGTPIHVAFVWDENGEMAVPITVTPTETVNGSPAVATVYTVTLKQMPKADKPAFMIQPQGAIYTLCPKDPAPTAMTVVASANGALSYQWFKAEDAEGANAVAVEGATAASYAPALTVPEDAYYFCRVTNTVSTQSADSAAVLVKVYPDPTPTASLKTVAPALTVTEFNGYAFPVTNGFFYMVGDAATPIEVEYTCPVADAEISTMWWRGNSSSSAENGLMAITPKTTASEALKSSSQSPYGMNYYCTVKATVNGRTYSADTEKLWTFVGATEDDLIAPVISLHPVSAEYDLNASSKNLSANIDYTTNVGVKYQWYVNTENSYEGAVPVATNGTYTTYAPPTTEAGTRFYFCKVTNNLQGYTKSSNTDIAEIKIHGEVPIPFKEAGTEADPYTISTVDELKELKRLVNVEGADFTDKFVKLTADLTLTNESWTSSIGCTKDGTHDIQNGNNLRAFPGTFDGDNHTLTFDGTGTVKPLFGYVRNTTIKNLNIQGTENVVFEDHGLISTVEGVGLSGTAAIIDHVTLKSGTKTTKSGLVGGTMTTNPYAAASATFKTTITNCVVEEGCIIGVNGDQNMIGGIAGRLICEIDNCEVSATVKGKNFVGGILATCDNAMGPAGVTNSAFHGTVISTGKNAGGIVGGGYENETAPNGMRIKLENNTVDGTVKGVKNVGGIQGGDEFVAQSWGATSVINNTFTGKVEGTENVGAIIGFYDSLNKFNNVSGNLYAADCGADKGIGAVKYIDTNYADPTPAAGTIYFSTENSTEDCPVVSGCAWKVAHNRTDDPLGADADKLCKVIEEAGPVPAALQLASVAFYSNGNQTGYGSYPYEVIGFDPAVRDFTVVMPNCTMYLNVWATLAEGAEGDITLKYTNTSGSEATKEIPNAAPTSNGVFFSDIVSNNSYVGNTATVLVGGVEAYTMHIVRRGTLDSITLTGATVAEEFSFKTYEYTADAVLDTIKVSYEHPWGLDTKQTVSGAGAVNPVWDENGKADLTVSVSDINASGDSLPGEYVFHLTRVNTAAAEAVVAEIAAIGEVTLDKAETIANVRAHYEALSELLKTAVTNLQTLKDAELALNTLQNPVSFLSGISFEGMNNTLYMTPAFDGAIRDYTLYTTDTETWLYVNPVLAEEYADKTMQAEYEYYYGGSAVKALTSGTKTMLSSLTSQYDYTPRVLTVNVGGQLFRFTVRIAPSIQTLTLSDGTNEYPVITSANTQAMGKYYAREFSLDIPVDAVLTAEVTTNNSSNPAATVSSFTWDASHKAEAEVTVTISAGEDVVPNVVKLHLNEIPTSVTIVKAPDQTGYKVGQNPSAEGLELSVTYANGDVVTANNSEVLFDPAIVKANSESVTVLYHGAGAVQPIELVPTFSGEGTEEDPFVITTAQQMVDLAAAVNNGLSFEGKTFVLGADVELPADWTPIGCKIDASISSIQSGKNLYPFSATFDGQDHTLTVANNSKAPFGYVRGATIKNLNLFGTKINGCGLIANMEGVGLHGTAVVIDNVTIKTGTTITGSGFLSYTVTENSYAGAAADYVSTIRNCTVEEGVTIGGTYTNTVGSFAGRFQGTIENCVSSATVNGYKFVGGIIACRDNAMGDVTVKNCAFHGTLTTASSTAAQNAGGIVGGTYMDSNNSAPNGHRTNIIGNTCDGTISGMANVGGIFGGCVMIAQAWDAYEFRDNVFTGTIARGNADTTGAIIGFYDSLNKWDDIHDNTFSADCGAERGIGKVKYVDTSFENPTAVDGVTYINTANGTADCPSVTGCGWKPNHNRTDDPLGADADKLCKVISAPEHTVTVNVGPKTVNAFFYTDAAATVPVAADKVVDNGVKGNYHVYTVTLPEGECSYRGEETVSGVVQPIGGEQFTVGTEDFSMNLVRANFYVNSNAMTHEDDWTLTGLTNESTGKEVVLGAKFPNGTNKIMYQAALLRCGAAYSGSTLTVNENLLEDYYVKAQLAKFTVGATAYTVQNKTLSISAYNRFTLVVPADAEKVEFFKQTANYVVVPMETSEMTRTENEEDNTVTYAFKSKTTTFSGTMSYRVSKTGATTLAGFFANNTTAELNWSDKAPTATASTAAAAYDDNSVLLNVDDGKDTNELAMNVGETFKLRAFRAPWQIVDTTTGNHMIEPDFHCSVLSGSDVVTVTPVTEFEEGKTSGNASGNWMNITATAPGTAVIAVWYDGIEITGSTYNGFYGATAPNRYGYVVVNVGADNTVAITPLTHDGDWDAEFDTVYYVGSEGGTFSFTSDAATTVTVTSLNGASMGGTRTVTADENGVWNVPVFNGSNLITVNGSDYRLVRAAQISIGYTNVTTGETASDLSALTVTAGDTLSLHFNGLHMPIPKMSGIYNPGYMGTAKTAYVLDDSFDLLSAGTQYDFATSAKSDLSFKVPTAGEHTLKGYISLSSMGDSFGNHRNITDAGRGANTSASEVFGAFGILPELHFTAQESETPAFTYEEVTKLKSVQLIVGGTTAYNYYVLFKTMNENNADSWKSSGWKGLSCTVTAESFYNSLSLTYWYEGEEPVTLPLTSGVATILSDEEFTVDTSKVLHLQITVTPADPALGEAKVLNYLVMGGKSNLTYVHPFMTGLTAVDGEGNALSLNTPINYSKTDYVLDVGEAETIDLSATMLQKYTNKTNNTQDKADTVTVQTMKNGTAVGTAVTVAPADENAYPVGSWELKGLDISEADAIRITVTSYVDGTQTVYNITLQKPTGEDAAIEDFVRRFYSVCLGRENPGEEEIAYYMWEIKDNGMTGSEVAGKFIFSHEFFTKNYCDRHYVEALYNTFMGRVPGDAEVGHWVWQLQQGKTREEVFNSFLSSEEFASFCAQAGIEAGSAIEFEGKGTRSGGRCTVDGCKSADGLDRFVKRLYNVTLDRDPAQDELDAWVYFLIHGDHTAKTASHEFLFSEEFIGHGYDDEVFADYLYRAMMGRTPGTDEVGYWVWRFSTGVTREDAFNEFADSDEFALICQDYGINCQ